MAVLRPLAITGQLGFAISGNAAQSKVLHWGSAVEPFSVVDKEIAPPSGDKHDYMSQAPYFWPNPDTANHLPYVRRDGERNPEIKKIPDHVSMRTMSATTHAAGCPVPLKRPWRMTKSPVAAAMWFS